jgi:hypothetical protein
MTTFSDLPPAVIQRITQLARGRPIAGCNRYAAVCRQWQDEGVLDSEEAEPLQLYLQLDHLEEEQVVHISSWMQKHGQQVDVLVMDGRTRRSVVEHKWFIKAAPGLTRIKRLEVEAPDSLALLAPVLQSLPQLQHLSAHIRFCPRHSGPQQDWEESGLFSENVLRNLQVAKSCPQLTHLHLTLYTWRGASAKCKVAARLPWLLPAGLKQLRLHSTMPQIMESSGLQHLTALQQLTLEGVGVVGPAMGLGALQQLRLDWPHTHIRLPDDSFALELAGKVTQWGIDNASAEDLGAAAAFLHLTRLDLSAHGETAEAACVAAVAALTGLQQLSVKLLSDAGTAAVLQQAAGVATLRSLVLRVGGKDATAVSSSLAQCGQLTSLMLNVYGDNNTPGGSPFATALQQLTGLRCLRVHDWLLQQGGGAWLAPLTGLHHLHVDLEGVVPHDELLAGVQGWPAGLKHVVVWYPFGLCVMGEDPACKTFSPAAPSSGDIMVWVERDEQSAAGWARPFRRCPYLPSFWELQGPASGACATCRSPEYLYVSYG